jgi:nucleoside-diphosphate-sugar epimerase
MRIFVAGATGTLGRPVVAHLVGRGHVVVGLTRFEANRTALEAMGARAVVGDALDRVRVWKHVTEAHPEVVVQLLTALPASGPPRAKHLDQTNRLRTTGTAYLIEAAAGAGARRLVAESFVGVYGPARFASPAAEDVALPGVGRGAFSRAALALREMESQLAASTLETVALRIGFLYGHGVPATAQWISDARKGRLVAPRGLPGVSPFVHLDDAAAAVVTAIEHPVVSRVYNVVDDVPASMETFLDTLGVAVSGRPPRHVPAWLIRLLMPVFAELGSASLRLSNAKARRELGWDPRYHSFAEGLAALGRRVQGTAAPAFAGG